MTLSAPLFAILSGLLTVLSMTPYVIDVVRGRTRPHAFTWIIWTLLTAIGAAGQLSGGAGLGGWITALTAVGCALISTLALARGERAATPVDWACLGGALAALPLWALTSSPLGALILITIIDALGFVPTIRKSFYRPHEETLSLYVVSAFKWVFALGALEHHSLVTALYPSALVVLNGAMVVQLTARRRMVRPSPPPPITTTDPERKR